MPGSSVHSGEIQALLGPTNTGKTHRAVERMLDYDTGMIGVPLRLLARELYDRVVARRGDEQVALLTGEEKLVPRHPRYFVCTTESMPLEREVEFVAVDEIQLAQHRQRGHTFTARMLHTRGTKETWFLGASTIEPLVAELLPTARIVHHPRYSILRDAGQTSLGRLPPRSAVVAFSSAEVYRIAERLRHRHGGVAVVLGALSPRTRNAQVELYQAGEVRHIVATDAIGMGLNMDIDHVAFAGLRKFDGTTDRELEPAELAQIAGRAGRFRNDGTFGTVAPLPALSPAVVRAIEEHRFPALSQVQWRNVDLDFRSLDTLATSLRQPPPRRCLRLPDDADDARALAWLATRHNVRQRCRSPEHVALLWDLCQIPDYQRLLVDHHFELLEELLVQLTSPHGRLREDWLAAQLAPIDDTRGGIDHLMARIGFVRTWTYVTHRRDWVDRPTEWQARTRDIEDRLSDALHEALLKRFVARATVGKGSVHRKRVAGVPSAVEARGDWHQPLAQLAALHGSVDDHDAAPERETAALVEDIVDAPTAALQLDADGNVRWTAAATAEPSLARVIARLVPGRDLVQPQIVLRLPGTLSTTDQGRLTKHLTAWLRERVHQLLAPLWAESSALDEPVRGLVYCLAQNLGAAKNTAVRRQLQRLRSADRRALERHGIAFGQLYTYAPASFSRPALALRQALCVVQADHTDALRRFPVGARHLRLEPSLGPELLCLLGYAQVDHRAFRIDLLEQLATHLRRRPPEDTRALDRTVGKHFGINGRQARGLLARLDASPVRKRTAG